jgi:phage/plasmid-associated DNA primase
MSNNKTIQFAEYLINNANHYEFAKIFYEQLSETDDYMYYDNTWYSYDEFNKILIHKKSYPSKLKLSIIQKTRDFISDIKIDINKLKLKNMDEIKQITNLNLKLDKLINTVSSNSFVNNIIEIYKDLITKPDIHKLLNSNKYLIAFEDCVYDHKIMEYRDIKKTDYISIYCNYKMKNVKKDVKIYDNINSIIYSCFEDQEMVKYIINIFSCSLIENYFQNFYILCGSGGNGKGILMMMLKNALSDLFYQTGSSFLSTKYDDDKPNPSLFQLQYSKICSISEPASSSNSSSLNTALIKLLTSTNDSIRVRTLNSEPIEYTPQFTPFFQCNLIPNINEISNGERRRLKIIKFPFQFVDKDKIYENENNRLINSELNNIIKTRIYAQQFMHLLIENLKELYLNFIYDEYGYKKIPNFKIPDKIEKESNIYLNSIDAIKSFVEEKINYNSKTSIKKVDLFKEYKKYDETMNKQKFYQIINRDYNWKIIKINGYEKYAGIQFKTDDDDDKDDDDNNNNVKNPLDL